MGFEPVTVAVTNYNGERYLPWCLEAVHDLDPRPAEVLVVDNASTDGSAALVEGRFPGVRLLRLPENRGPCPARNLALREARHELVFQLDCDVAPEPDCLRRLLEVLSDRGPEAAACQPRAVFHDRPDLVHYEGGFFHYTGVMTLLNFYRPVPREPSPPREVDAVVSMALLLRRSAVLEAGGYDPRFFILYEDHDLSYRLRLRGKKLFSVPGARVLHREGTEGVSFRRSAAYPRRRVFLQSRNRWIVLAKNHALRSLLAGFPGLLLFEAAWFAFSIREGFPLDYMKGKISFLRMLRGLLADRRSIQAGRIVRDRELLRAEDLTFSPLIRRSGPSRALEAALSRALRLWWRLAAPFAG